MSSYDANDILLKPIKAPTDQRTGTATRTHNWAPEIAALLCSAAALIVIIILLMQEDQKPLDDWKAPFSLNTVASILSVVFRTPLAFAVGSCLGQGKWSLFSKRSGPVAVFAAIDEALGELGIAVAAEGSVSINHASCVFSLLLTFHLATGSLLVPWPRWLLSASTPSSRQSSSTKGSWLRVR